MQFDSLWGPSAAAGTLGGKEELLGHSNQIKITQEVEHLKDKEPVARQGFVPAILKCQHCSCSMAQRHIIFSGSGSLKISLWCKQVIQKPGNSASLMPYVYPSVNMLQHKAGTTYLAKSKRGHRYTVCVTQSRGGAVGRASEESSCLHSTSQVNPHCKKTAYSCITDIRSPQSRRSSYWKSFCTVPGNVSLWKVSIHLFAGLYQAFINIYI